MPEASARGAHLEQHRARRPSGAAGARRGRGCLDPPQLPATQQSGVPAAISGLRSLLLLGCLERQGARHIHTAPSVLWVAVRGGGSEEERARSSCLPTSLPAAGGSPGPGARYHLYSGPRRWTEAIALKQLLNRDPRSFLIVY